MATKISSKAVTIKSLTSKDIELGVVLRAKVRSASDGRRSYTVIRRRTWACECPHHRYRHPEGGCKHIKAVKAATK